MEWTHTELEAREGRDVSSIYQCVSDEKTVELLITIVKLFSVFFVFQLRYTDTLFTEREVSNLQDIPLE